MSLSRPVRPFLVLAALALTVFACGPADRDDVTSATRPKDRGNVKRVTAWKEAQIIDVYKEGTCAIPEVAEIHVNARSRKGHAGGHMPSVINWIGPPDQTLLIEWKETAQKGMHKDIICRGARCQAITNIDFRDADKTESKYRVWIDKVTQACDPVVIVDNCCG